MAVATQLEVFNRDKAVEKMVLSGLDSRIILRKIAKNFGLEERMAYNYLTRAVERLREAAKIDRPLEVTRANERFHKVFRDSMKVRTKTVYKILKERDEEGKIIGDKLVPCEEEIPPNHFAAIAAERARADLLGLNAPKKVEATITHTFSGKPLAEFKTEAELDALEAGIAEGKYLVQNGVVIDAVFEDLPKNESGESEQ